VRLGRSSVALALLALAGSSTLAVAQRENPPEGAGENRTAPRATLAPPAAPAPHAAPVTPPAPRGTPPAPGAPAPAEPGHADVTTPAARSIAEEVRSLRTEVEALGRRAEPATQQDVERLRAAIVRLESAQRDLARRIDDRMVPPASEPDPPVESSRLAPLWLALGAMIGGVASRMLQRRRDGRQRSRLRI